MLSAPQTVEAGCLRCARDPGYRDRLGARMHVHPEYAEFHRGLRQTIAALINQLRSSSRSSRSARPPLLTALTVALTPITATGFFRAIARALSRTVGYSSSFFTTRFTSPMGNSSSAV